MPEQLSLAAGHTPAFGGSRSPFNVFFENRAPLSYAQSIWSSSSATGGWHGYAQSSSDVQPEASLARPKAAPRPSSQAIGDPAVWSRASGGIMDQAISGNNVMPDMSGTGAPEAFTPPAAPGTPAPAGTNDQVIGAANRPDYSQLGDRTGSDVTLGEGPQWGQQARGMASMRMQGPVPQWTLPQIMAVMSKHGAGGF